MVSRFEKLGDRHDGIDDRPGSLDALLELSRGRKGKACRTRRGRISGSRPASRREDLLERERGRASSWS